MKTLKTLLFFVLLASVIYKANAYYQYRVALQAVPVQVRTVKARGGGLQITLSGTGNLQALETKLVAVRELQSRMAPTQSTSAWSVSMRGCERTISQRPTFRS